MRIVITGADTEAELTAALDKYFTDHLGPAIEADAKRYAPKRTGKMAQAISFRVENHRLIVEAGVRYAVFVELGHMVAHGPGMSIVGPKMVPPQPFLQAALFTVRD
jgi:hypothetical protein